MRNTRKILGSRRVVRLAFAGVAAASLAGCADTDRFGSNPLGNPFSTASADRPAAPERERDRDASFTSSAPVGAISSRPLPPPAAQASAMPDRRVGQNYASYSVPAHESPRLAQAAPSRSEISTASIATGHGGWSAEGGMPVVAASGESAKVIGDRYNVPVDVLLRANNLASASQVRPGTRLVIPVYSTAGAASRVAEAPKEAGRNTHASREKLLARHETKEPPRFVKGPQPVARAAEAEKRDHGRAAALEKVAKPAARTAKAAPAPAPTVKVATAAKVESPKVETPKAEAPKPVKLAKAEPVEVKKPAPAVDPTPTASLPPASAATAAVSAGPGNPEFRWPARGRIIQGFKAGGNDGINIAVPEGTAVKAAEAGVVAYAGSEIKGFGNLVLIRHPNGYVSAYANNGEIGVKKGEQVKRGQTIAKSGQSGNVASPQLHFELRKGSTPVDPTQYLAGA